jgi:anti-sigma factor RsiW
MNCRRFQNRLYEYLDGTLSRWSRAAAERHLARCAQCRQALRQEQQLAQSLSRELEKSAQSLLLEPGLVSRLETTLANAGCARSHAPVRPALWMRLAGSAAVATSLLAAMVLLDKFVFRSRGPAPETSQGQSRHAPTAVSIELSFQKPTYMFRREGDFVVDAFSYNTNLVKTTLWVGKLKPIGGKKMPL